MVGIYIFVVDGRPIFHCSIGTQGLRIKFYTNPDAVQACAQVGAAGSDPALNKFSVFKDACWRFLRPHTIRGTALGST